MTPLTLNQKLLKFADIADRGINCYTDYSQLFREAEAALAAMTAEQDELQARIEKCLTTCEIWYLETTHLTQQIVDTAWVRAKTPESQ